MTYNAMWRRLAAVYDENEAKAVCRMLLEELFGFSLADIMCGAAESLPEAGQALLRQAMTRLENSEPIQYVLGQASFCGRTFHVEPGVLIPRPETELLCELLKKAASGIARPAILDIGTGSGCIAVTAALDIPMAEVTAWDISEKALRIASGNAASLGAGVCFRVQDALNAPDDHDEWDAIVSNPPYICDKEKAGMERNVLDNEPHLALFVPDTDPLLFYRKIAEYAKHALKDGGSLLFEINPLYADRTAAMLRDTGFADIMTLKDLFGKDRNIICRKIQG